LASRTDKLVLLRIELQHDQTPVPR
jgi:hypothetical protein